MAEAHEEDQRHQQLVTQEVNALLKRDTAAGHISISGIQNPSLQKWANKKGVIFDTSQKVDILVRG